MDELFIIEKKNRITFTRQNKGISFSGKEYILALYKEHETLFAELEKNQKASG